MKTKKKKAPKISTLKNKLWSLTSQIVRLRDANADGYAKCCTCDTVKFWRGEGLQAGHFCPAARGGATRWLLININAQCGHCNGPLSSNPLEYYAFMLEKHGQAEVDALRRKSHDVVKVSRGEYEEMIDERAAMLARMILSHEGQLDIPRMNIENRRTEPSWVASAGLREKVRIQAIECDKIKV
jgi:5-methylcytosine-specific restriction endonuclease McrA